MPNLVRNRLEIHCEDEVTMDKIKMMIFDEDKDRNRIFTLAKMLPMPVKLSENREKYDTVGEDWCRSMWGTKWDVYDYDISVKGSLIVVRYHTAWSPNENWVELLCLFVHKSIDLRKKEEVPKIKIQLRYYIYSAGIGGILGWVPNTSPKSKTYPIMKYAKIHDKALYKKLLEFEEKDRPSKGL